MLAGRHVALRGVACYDVDDVVEEVGFTVLAAEVLGREGGLAERFLGWVKWFSSWSWVGGRGKDVIPD